MRETGHTWRNRELNPLTTVRLFMLQILFGNVACNHVPHLAGNDATGSAYCAARGRLPLAALERLLARCTKMMGDCLQGTERWLGHRLFLIDGSSFSMSDTAELREHFGQPSGQQPGCGFPTAHVLALVHAGCGLVQRAIASPLHTHDLPAAPQCHPELAAGDVVVGDRAFCSYVHLAMLFSRGIFAVMRVRRNYPIIDFTPGRAHTAPGKNGKKGLPRSRWIENLGPCDQIVEWVRDVKPDWLSAEAFALLPEVLRVRELRYEVKRPGFRVKQVTLVTTLLDGNRYTKADLAEAYRLRWTIETCFGHLKTTMKMDVLRCQTVDGVMKELTMFLLVYNLVRMVQLQAARQQGVSVDRISFVDALRWLAAARPDAKLRRLVVNPRRPGRYEPRCKKRRPKQYDLMNKPRAVLRQRLATQPLTN
ncbi:MAG: IS4 family transposase [Pirellulales bacterium]|nr:IS4 family transposase [Pirellulales bacterium]